MDAEAGAYTRLREDGRIDSWKISTRASGLRYRALSGAAAETISMHLGNTGVTVATGPNPGTSYYGFSIARP